MGNEIDQYLESEGIKFVRILWCDNANVIRAKAVHAGMFSDFLTYGVGIGVVDSPDMADVPFAVNGLDRLGQVQLVPDLSTLMPLPYAPGHARVMGNMLRNGDLWQLCPRTFLQAIAADAQTEGFEVIAAFENEFYLLERSADGRVIPSDYTGFGSTLAMDMHRPVIDDIAEALIAQGIIVEQYYPEAGPGQQEISVLYTQALGAADQQVAFRETVKAIAYQHHLKASFLPKIFPNKSGNGCHLHLSLWHQGENLLPDPNGILGLSEVARHFIGGILHHLKALMAITTPISNSYRRLTPHSESGAFCCWGLDNREASVRVIGSPDGGGATHFELKTVDASANPYLALGGAIAAGLDGVRNRLEPGEPVEVDPGDLSDSERRARGIERLPENVESAIKYLEEDEVLLEALGSDLARAFLAVRQAEWEALKDLELEEEVRLLLERY